MDQGSDRILRIRTVLERTGLSRSTLYRKIQNGTFPKQISISTRCAGWRESAVAAWMRNPMFYSVEDTSVDCSAPSPVVQGFDAVPRACDARNPQGTA